MHIKHQRSFRTQFAVRREYDVCKWRIRLCPTHGKGNCVPADMYLVPLASKEIGSNRSVNTGDADH